MDALIKFAMNSGTLEGILWDRLSWTLGEVRGSEHIKKSNRDRENIVLLPVVVSPSRGGRAKGKLQRGVFLFTFPPRTAL